MLEKLFSPETYQMLGVWALGFCKNLVIALLVYFIGKYIVKWINHLVAKLLKKSNVEPSLASFLKSIVSVVCWFCLIIIIISILGIETSSFIVVQAFQGGRLYRD